MDCRARACAKGMFFSDTGISRKDTRARQDSQILLLTVSVTKTLLSREPWPCDPAAETASQSQIGAFEAYFPTSLLIQRSVFLSRTCLLPTCPLIHRTLESPSYRKPTTIILLLLLLPLLLLLLLLLLTKILIMIINILLIITL